MINVVCAVIQRPNGQVLVCQRPLGTKLSGKWEFPGGKIEPNETAAQAIVREIDEELACAISILTELPTVEHHYPDFSLTLTPFLCHLVPEETPNALEHQAIQWLELNACHTLDWAAADVPIWQSLLEDK